MALIVVIRLQTANLTNHGSIPGWGERFILSSNCLDKFITHV
jgi:hypothetical protein